MVKLKFKFGCIGYLIGSLMAFTACDGWELMHRATPDKDFAFATGLGVGIFFASFMTIALLMMIVDLGGDK